MCQRAPCSVVPTSSPISRKERSSGRPQVEDHPGHLGELLHRRPEQRALLGDLQPVLGGRRLDRRLVPQGREDNPPPPALHVENGVGGDSQQPGPPAGPGQKRVAPVPGAEEGLLGQVLGVVRIADRAVDEPVDRSPVLVDRRDESVVTGQDALLHEPERPNRGSVRRSPIFSQARPRGKLFGYPLPKALNPHDRPVIRLRPQTNRYSANLGGGSPGK